MAYLSDWATGTITVTNGSTAVTGVGTVWNGAGLAEGDIIIANNLVGVIASVNSATSITLTLPWQGATAAGIGYRARYQSDGSRYTAVAKQVLQDLQAGNLSALSGLTGTANALPMFTGAGAMTTLATGATGRAVLGAATQDAAAAQGGYVRRSGGTNMNDQNVTIGWATAGDGLLAQVNATPFGYLWTDTRVAANAASYRATLGAFSSSGGTIGGNTNVTGVLTVSVTAIANYMALNGTVASEPSLAWQTSGSNRWNFAKTTTAETGSNDGSNFAVNRWSDAGAYLGTPFNINRRYGIVETRDTPKCFVVPSYGVLVINAGQQLGLLGDTGSFVFNGGGSGSAFTIGGNPGAGGRVVHCVVAGWYKVTMYATGYGGVIGLARNGTVIANIHMFMTNYGAYSKTQFIFCNTGDSFAWSCVSGPLTFAGNESGVTFEMIQLP